MAAADDLTGLVAPSGAAWGHLWGLGGGWIRLCGPPWTALWVALIAAVVLLVVSSAARPLR